MATDTHHIFGAALRNKSEQYGLTVRLCRLCHTEDKNAVHRNRIADIHLKQAAQKRSMEVYGWTIDEFRIYFRKNYL